MKNQDYEVKINIDELKGLIEELGFDISDLSDIELLASCTGTCDKCQSTCQNCVSGGSNGRP